jgi:hypothetical protein
VFGAAIDLLAHGVDRLTSSAPLGYGDLARFPMPVLFPWMATLPSEQCSDAIRAWLWDEAPPVAALGCSPPPPAARLPSPNTGRSSYDLDGHHWEVIWMDPKMMPQ